MKRKLKFLFLDDRTKRIHAAFEKWGSKFDLTICTNVREALRLLSNDDFDIVSLDCDLGGDDFVDLDEWSSIMELVRYLEKTGWPTKKPKPRIYIHSSNAFAAHEVGIRLKKIFGKVETARFVYPEPHKKPYYCGLVAGAFDVIHPGYIALLKEAKSICDILVVALNVDPSVENDKKDKPVLSASERVEILLSLRYVDDVYEYRDEAGLVELLEQIKPDVRILGSDYKDKAITGANFNIPIYYHTRSTWSASRFKRMIRDSVLEEK